MVEPKTFYDAWNERGLLTYCFPYNTEVEENKKPFNGEEIIQELYEHFTSKIKIRRLFVDARYFNAIIKALALSYESFVGRVLSCNKAYLKTDKDIEIYCDSHLPLQAKVTSKNCGLIVQLEHTNSAVDSMLKESLNTLEKADTPIPTQLRENEPSEKESTPLENLVKVCNIYKRQIPSILDWGLLTPDTLAHAIDHYTSLGNTPDILLINGSLFNRVMSRKIFADFYDPASKYEMRETGLLGTIMNVRVYTDQFLPRDQRFIQGLQLKSL